MLLFQRSIENGTVRKAARAALAALGLALLGCGGAAQQFEPVHAASGLATTYAVAAYDLRIGPSTVGKATVWSEGAADASQNGGNGLDLQMAIHNTTQAPLEMDVASSSVNVTSRDGRTQSLGIARRVEGSRTVAPVSSGRVGLRYALPEGLRAEDIRRFEFSWRVASPAGDYAQSTAFVSRSLTSSDSLSDRGFHCTGVHRPVTLEECIDPPPLPTTFSK